MFRCPTCHALFYLPFLKRDELSRYYPETYGRYRASKSAEKKTYDRGVARFVLENYYGYPSRKGRSAARQAAALFLSFFTAKGAFPYRGEGNFLDVGCGAGSYLHRIKRWGWNVYGVEPGKAGVDQARSLGLDVHHGFLEEAAFPDRFFDVIRLHHVLEHLPEPQIAFREVARILRPDGIVYITVPNTRSLNFRLFGEHWYALDAPRHVVSYCPKTLATLCDATGFEILRTRFNSGAFNFVRSVQYVLEEDGARWPRCLRRIDWPRNKLVRRTLKPCFLLIDRLRLGDVMTATLRKRKERVDDYRAAD